MCFKEVPHDLERCDVRTERILVSPVASAVNHLSPLTAVPPHLARPAPLTVQAGGVAGADLVTVHGSQEVPEVGHLDGVVIPVIVHHSPVRSGAQVAREAGVVGDDCVLQAVEVDDADRPVRHEVKTSERGAGHSTHCCQAGSQE